MPTVKISLPLDTIMNIDYPVGTTIPNASETQQTKQRGIDWSRIIPPSDESVIDDSDADPNFSLPKVKKKKLLHKVIPTSSSSSNSSDTSLDSTSSGSGSESEDEIRDDGVVTDAIQELEEQNAVIEDGNDKSNEEKRGKKRLRKEHQWNCRVTKHLTNTGKAYQSLSKSKKVVTARKIRAPCESKCKLHCSSNIDEEKRKIIFDAFWKLGDLQQQREFIVRHTKEIKPKYRYSCTQNYRSLNKAFHFDIDGTQIRVCKTFFKATLDLSNTYIRTALSKKDSLGVVAADLRGKHGNQPTVYPEIKASVVKFIDAIPRIESHYLRAQTSREFICSDKSLADLYRDYKEERENNQLPFTSASTFNRIFNTEFNISFFVPKKDLCDLCESYKNADVERKVQLREAYEQHLVEKNLARTEKENDKNRKDGAIVAVYDLQAVMQITKGQVSLFFYKSRINCLNFTISDLNVKNVVCYFWDETDAKRGAVEIGLCVLHHIDMLLDKNPDKDIDIIFYSDNCPGQQKNKFLLSAYAYAVVNKRVNSITHKFLIRGHSQNEVDNVHSVIEKQIKRHLKAGPIYTPSQYTTLIRTAKKTGCPYKVEEMTFDKFYDMKLLQEEWGNNFNLDENKNQVKWQDIKVLRVEKEHPGAFFHKTSFAEEDYKKTFVRKRRTQEDLTVFKGLTKAYTQKIPLTEAKRKDIQELINKCVIPKPYVDSYYKNVLGDI